MDDYCTAMEYYCMRTKYPAPPPPPPPVSNAIDRLIKEAPDYFVGNWIPYFLLLVLLFCLGLHALHKRLWLLSSLHRSRLFALNASTLGLLGIVTKVAKPRQDSQVYCSDNSAAGPIEMLGCNVLICAVVGALMPSIATSTDIRDMWTNFLGVGLLIVSTNFIIFLQMFYVPEGSRFPMISREIAGEHEIVMASQFLLLLVLLVQMMALGEIISDMNGTILEHLQQLCMEAKPGYKTNVVVQRPWSWEVVERNTRIKLMMVLTSSPQNVMARSPCVAIVGTLVVCCILTQNYYWGGAVFDYIYIGTIGLLQWSTILAFGVISVWRWVMVALQQEISFSSLLSNAEPSYWRRKVNNFQHMLKADPYAARRNVRKEGHCGFKEVVSHMAAFFMLYFIIPVHWLLVAMIRLVHIFSALLMQKLFWQPVKSLGCGIFVFIKRLCKIKTKVADDSTNFESLGVVCLEGEDAGVVWRAFAGAHNRIIRTQLKKAKTKADLKDLIIILKGIKNPISLLQKSNGIVDVLHQDGAPYVENLHVEHGYQYGWSLTMVALLDIMTEIEVTGLGKSVVSDVAMNACWQAMDMMQVIDEQFVPCIVCSKETYAKAFASKWSKPARKKKWRWSQERTQATPAVKPDEILMRILESEERHMEEFNKARNSYIAAAWPQQTVVSYTMHLVCRNMSRWWSDLESTATANSLEGGGLINAREMIESMVEHMKALLADVLACCLVNLSTAIDMSMTEAVLSGSVSKIEKGLLLFGQGKHLWEELQWTDSLHSPKNTGFGQLRQWFHLSDMSNACTT